MKKMEEKETCATMQPCKGEVAELHNQRIKELDYIRKDLSDQNTNVVWTTIKEQMRKIRTEYKKATGQKLQRSAEPIQEIVVVTAENTTSAHIEKFCELIKQLGMIPLSYAIHRDEGHYEPLTGEWIPNFHAHIIADTTCWVHRRVERTKKSRGKNIKDPVTNHPVKIGVDGYAKTIKFTRQDMSRLQDFAAEATGLKRGKSKRRKHLDSLQFKVQKLTEEVKRLTGITENQKAEISAREKQIREHVQELENLTRRIEEKERVLADLDARKTAMSIVVSAKGAVTSWFGKPVNRQIEKVMRENEELGKALKVMSERVAELEQAKARSSKEREEREQMIGHQDEKVHTLIGENDGLKETIRKKDAEIRRLEAQRVGLMQQRNKQIAENLLDNASPEQIQQYERQGLPELIGDDIWTDAKVSSGSRKRVRDRQQRHESDVNPTRHPGRQDFTPGEGPSRHQ